MKDSTIVIGQNYKDISGHRMGPSEQIHDVIARLVVQLKNNFSLEFAQKNLVDFKTKVFFETLGRSKKDK